MKKLLKAAHAASRGFSLVELMVVVAIIGILASLALPRFRIFQAKARQSEAKSTLAQIYTLEQAYYGEFDTYVPLTARGFQGNACAGNEPNELGFLLDGCDGEAKTNKVRYSYAVELTDGGAGFNATATSGDGPANRVLAGCPAETWTMTHQKILTVANDVTKACNN